ncbi:MAG: hypothetical protein M2R45_03841 [Verrucomicrobia subdivision 3 bacterium]|nr:hypothetical protein [Limisphaerales bacterium]MCS1415797.1 hypothetical protein [Limisphaerales bacterium]
MSVTINEFSHELGSFVFLAVARCYSTNKFYIGGVVVSGYFYKQMKMIGHDAVDQDFHTKISVKPY